MSRYAHECEQHSKRAAACLDAIDAISRQPHIEITIRVPVDDADFSGCTHRQYSELGEFAGARFVDRWTEIDLSGATYNGLPCEIRCRDEAIAEDYIKQQRGIYP